MTSFEPELPSILEVYDEKDHALKSFSDNDLLLELRRRGRLQRIVQEQVIEGWRRAHGAVPPQDYIITRLMRDAGYAIGAHLSAGSLKVPGMKIEEGRFEIPGMRRMDGDYHTPDLRYRIPFNFVVDKP